MRQLWTNRVAAVAFVVAMASIVAACGLDTSRILSPEGCSPKASINVELHVDPTDDRWIWGIDRDSGAPVSLRLAGNYGVSTTPPAIVDPTGRVVGRTGDILVSGCHDIIQNAVMIDETDIR